jgi:hypothetical protein
MFVIDETRQHTRLERARSRRSGRYAVSHKIDRPSFIKPDASNTRQIKTVTRIAARTIVAAFQAEGGISVIKDCSAAAVSSSIRCRFFPV